MTDVLKGVVNQCLQYTLKQLQIQKFVFRIEKEAVSAFLSGINSIDREPLESFLLARISKVTFKRTTRDAFLSETHKISESERREAGLRYALIRACPNFNKVSEPIQKNLVSRLLHIFFHELMAKMEVGVDSAIAKEDTKVQREEKKKELLGLDVKKLTPLTTITNRKIEENLPVTRYVAGFAAYALVKRKCPTELAKRIIKVQTTTNLDTTIDLTESWTDKLSRGGLAHVTDEFFELVKIIKRVSDLIYVTDIKRIRHQNLKTKAIQHILQNEEICRRWKLLYNNPDSKKWLLKLLDVFLNTRGKCLVRDMLEQYQHDTKETLKAKKALRKGLKEKSQESEKSMSPKKKRAKIQEPNNPSQMKNLSGKTLNSDGDKYPKNKIGERKTNNSQTLKAIPTLHIPDPHPKSSSSRSLLEKESKENLSGTYAFLEGDPDCDIYLQFLPQESVEQQSIDAISPPGILIANTCNSSQNLGQIERKQCLNASYDFLNGDPDCDIFMQFLSD